MLLLQATRDKKRKTIYYFQISLKVYKILNDRYFIWVTLNVTRQNVTANIQFLDIVIL